jgi:cyclohexanecarboxylate-CoA ligase
LTPTNWDSEAAARWRRLGLWPDEPLGDTLTLAARRWGHRVAVVDHSTRITFGRLDELSRRLATVLLRCGVVPGDVVCLQLPSWWETIALTVASWRVGAVANPVLPNLRAREMAAITGEVTPRVLVVPERFRGFEHRAMADSIDHGAHLIVVRCRSGDDPGDLARLVAEAEPADDQTLEQCRPEPDAAALVLYTSGTSGRAKGVIHTHNTLRAEADGVGLGHQCRTDDVMLLTMPLAHIGGVLYGILLLLTTGLRVVLMDTWDSDEALRLTEQEGVTVHPTVPVVARGLLRAPSFRPAAVRSMRLLTFGGASVTPADVEEAAAAFGCWCKRSYGSTEMPTLTSGPRHDPKGRVATTDGVVMGASEVRTVSDGGVDVGSGTGGEIWCRGPELFVGYVDAGFNPEAFAPGGWYRTGDLGTLDDDGFLTVTGRKKDVIIRGGENISPQEVEAVLLEQPEVSEVAVVAMPDPVMGERSCAFVVTSDPGFDFATMAARVRAGGLAAFKIPERLELRAALPRTPTGKIRKDALRDEIAGLLRAGDAGPPPRPA